mgnify:CR=1 FL=1
MESTAVNSPNRLVSPCNSKVAIVYTFPFSLNKHVQPYKLLHQYDQNQRCQDQQCGDGGQSGVEGQLQILVDGKEVSIRSPKDSFALHIGMIHQHLGCALLVPVKIRTER